MYEHNVKDIQGRIRFLAASFDKEAGVKIKALHVEYDALRDRFHKMELE